MKEGVGLSRIIDLAAIVGESVAYNEVVYLQYHIVAAYLLENLLGDVDRWSLVFNDDTWA